MIRNTGVYLLFTFKHRCLLDIYTAIPVFNGYFYLEILVLSSSSRLKTKYRCLQYNHHKHLRSYFKFQSPMENKQ